MAILVFVSHCTVFIYLYKHTAFIYLLVTYLHIYPEEWTVCFIREK